MAERQEYIKKLEEDASKLLKAINSLEEEVGSYKNAARELAKAREDLSELITKTGELTDQSHKLIKIMNEIGSSKIFQQLEEINATIDFDGKRVSARLSITIIGIILLIALQLYLIFIK